MALVSNPQCQMNDLSEIICYSDMIPYIDKIVFVKHFSHMMRDGIFAYIKDTSYSYITFHGDEIKCDDIEIARIIGVDDVPSRCQISSNEDKCSIKFPIYIRNATDVEIEKLKESIKSGTKTIEYSKVSSYNYKI